MHLWHLLKNILFGNYYLYPHDERRDKRHRRGVLILAIRKAHT